MASSDFFTGAFPAEYGNALSGVFDINMRNGNAGKREHTFQLGLTGIDFASESPFSKSKNASYLFNYRYSSLSLLSPLLPEDAEGTNYQDLSFKFNFPGSKSGTFSLWGIGAIDDSGQNAEKDPLQWEYNSDREDTDSKQKMGALGLSHKHRLGTSGRLHSTLSASGNGIEHDTKRMNRDLDLLPKESVLFKHWKYTLSSTATTKFGSRHTNRSGFTIDNLHYQIHLQEAKSPNLLQQDIVNENNNSFLFRAFTQSNLQLTQQLKLNLGLHAQYFLLNKKQSVEKRAAITYETSRFGTFGFAYGEHSKLNRLNIYFVRNSNKNLDFLKAKHYIFSYEKLISPHHYFKVESYYQYLYDIPVEDISSFSLLNLQDDWFVNSALQNNGSGRNKGIDLSFEKYMNRGTYYLVTASVFDSKYKGGDGILRPSRYDQNFAFNVLGGKEWQTGEKNQNVVSLNGKFSYQGGQRITPADTKASVMTEEIVLDSKRAFENKKPDVFLFSFTVKFRKNKAKHSSEWSFQIINALGTKENYGYKYNLQTQSIDKAEEVIIVPNIRYRIEF